MRRLVPLLLAALVLVGCGTERPAAVREADATFSPVPSPTASPTEAPHSPSATTTPVETGAVGQLAAFPLDLGYAETNGDDGSPVRVTDKPATRAFKECGREVWDPSTGADAIGVEFRGEAEWSRGRTLVRYPTVDAARVAVDRVDDAITSCPRDDGTDFGWTEHTGIDYQVGEQSFGWMDRYWSTDVDGFDTGLTVYHVTRVGPAVLLTYEYGEGNGSDETRRSAIARAAKADQPVVDVMFDL